MSHVEHHYEPEEYVPCSLRSRPEGSPAVFYYSLAWEDANGVVVDTGVPVTTLIRVLEIVPRPWGFADGNRPVIRRCGPDGVRVVYRWDGDGGKWVRVKP